ncbi:MULTISPECIES: dermonecrotic toxin domain-containing protein [Pseudomonas]|uniref:RING-type E3 ubiquitin transferase n=1 Tax=Pseudomonas fluorescens TaxID=294 RepID=A0AAN2L8N6_PSEFL|nr:DUF6543 domain-containing protein [Pseudomonas putida]
MQDSTANSSSGHADTLSSANFHVQFVRDQIPIWLRIADPAVLAKLAASLRASHTSNLQRSRLLAPLQRLDAFAAPLFSQAVQRRYGCELPQDTVYFLRTTTALQGFTLPSYRALWRRHYQHQSLLQAALHNFDELQAAPGSSLLRESTLRRGNTVWDKVPVESFVDFCRELDLGGQYLRHLRGVFYAADGGRPSSAISNAFAECDRYGLEVDAHLALIKGDISAALHHCVLELASGKSQVSYEGVPFVPKRLKLAGIEITGVTLFEARYNPPSPLAGLVRPWLSLVLHIPGDRIAPLRAYSSWTELEKDLAGRLANSGYQHSFIRRVIRRKWPALVQALRQRLYEGGGAMRVVRAEPDLALDALSLEQGMYDHLLTQRLAQMEDDARFCAVPTAEQDAQARHAVLQKALDIGLDVLGLAAFVLPGVGELLLGVTAAQLMGEVFTGLQDWAQGDVHEAFNCLTHVIEEVAGLAVGAVVVSTASSLVKNSALFKALVRVHRSDGSRRLWRADLAPYARRLDPSQVGEANAQGIYQFGAEQFISIDGHFYAVQQGLRPGEWRIRHPLRDGGWEPVVEHNAQGAWRCDFDSPHRWPDAAYALRRFGPRFSDFNDQEIEAMLNICGLDLGQLRQLHLQRQPVPAALLELCSRARLRSRLEQFEQQLMGAPEHAQEAFSLLALQRLPGWPQWRRLEIVSQLQAESPEVLQLLRSEVDEQGVLASFHGALSDDEQALLNVRQAGEQSAAQAMGKQMSLWLQAHRASFFDRCLAIEQPVGTSPLQLQFPGLAPELVARIEAEASEVERQRMSDDRHVPLRLAEQAAQALREARLDRALEGFFWPQANNADCNVLMLHAVQKDPHWPQGLRLQIEGPATPGVRRLFYRNDRFIVEEHSDDPPEGLLPLALRLAGIVPEQGQQAFSATLGSRVAAQRGVAFEVLGVAERGGWNAPQRWADRRIGYPLSGRGAVRVRLASLEEQLLELYPDFDRAQIDAFFAPYRAAPAQALALLHRLNEELRGLRVTLRRWQEQATSSRVNANRQQVSAVLIAAWQRRLTRIQTSFGIHLGYRLSLHGLYVESLPSLVADFSHVVELELSALGLRDVEPGFLSRFGRVRYLDLSNNALTRFPQVLEGATSLRHLSLRGNAVILDESGAGQLRALWQLETIDLTGNPLGRLPDVGGMAHLRRLQLRATGIFEVPGGLVDRPYLEEVDLRDNRINQLAPGFLDEPRDFLRRIHLDGNPLAPAQRRLLRARQNVLPMFVPALDAGGRFWIIDSVDRQVLERYWLRLQREPEAEALFSLFEHLAAVGQAHNVVPELRVRVQGLLRSMARSGMGRELAALVASSAPQVDAMTLLGRLELRVDAARALSSSLAQASPAALLSYARGSLRLQRLEAFVIQLIDQTAQWAGRRLEVFESYRFALGERLGLAGQALNLGADDIRVGEEQMRTAQAYVESFDDVQLSCVLIRDRYWVQYIRQRHDQAWHELENQFVMRAHRQRLREGGRAPAERERLEQGRQLQQAEDEVALLMQLTRAELGLPFDPGSAPRRGG